VPIVQRSLAAHFANKPLRLQDQQPQDLHRFILRQVPSGSRAYSKLMITALRSFLRFLCLRGSIKNDLASALVGVAHWRSSHLPKSLPPKSSDSCVAAIAALHPASVITQSCYC
jgi:hypothetical protein